MAEQLIKGDPVKVFINQSLNALSDLAVDCRGKNAVSVQVLVSGTTPSATVSVEGSYAEGGNYLPLPDANASQAAMAAAAIFDVTVGQPWVKIRIASISGTFGAGTGYTVIVTPYVSPGQANINVTNTANQNLAQYGGAAVGPTNPVDVQPGTGEVWDVSDRAARLLGKADAVAATPTPYNVALTLADTEYSQAMPANCRRFGFQCRGTEDVRFAFATGKVAAPTAPYFTLKAGRWYDSGPINQGAIPSTIYFACSTAGQVVEIEAWA